MATSYEFKSRQRHQRPAAVSKTRTSFLWGAFPYLAVISNRLNPDVIRVPGSAFFVKMSGRKIARPILVWCFQIDFIYTPSQLLFPILKLGNILFSLIGRQAALWFYTVKGGINHGA